MRAIPYNKNFFHYIEKWLKARDLKIPSQDEMPENGYVISDTSPIAMGFIRKVEGGYGMMDSFITDPDKDPIIRDKALDLLTKKLLDKAEDLKLISLVSYSRDLNTLVRAQKHGMQCLQHTVLVLPLSKSNVKG